MLKPLCIAAAISLSLLAGTSAVYAADQAVCEKQADEKKLHGAAKTSFVKKCASTDAAAAPSAAQQKCDATAAEKKLHGAAKTSFVKKCVADAK